MATEQSWDDSPSTNGPRSPFEVPPTPPPKDEHYQPRAPLRQKTYPLRSASIPENPDAADLAMRPPMSRYSTYIGLEKGKPQLNTVYDSKVAKHPTLSIRTKDEIHVTTNVTQTKSSPRSLRKFSSMDQLACTTTLINAGTSSPQDLHKIQTTNISHVQLGLEAPRLESPPTKAKPARKRNSLISRRPSLRRSVSQPTDLAAISQESQPSVESNKPSPPAIIPKTKRSKKAPAEVIPVLTPEDEDITALVKAPDSETDSDESSVRTSSSSDRPAGKSTRSSSLTISDANLAAIKAGIPSPISEPGRPRPHASDITSPRSPVSPGAKSRRSSCSSIPVVGHWNAPRAVPMLPASAIHRHGSEPAVPVPSEPEKLHRRSSSMHLLFLGRRHGSGSSDSTAASAVISSTNNKDSQTNDSNAITAANSILTNTTFSSKLQKSRRLTKSTPMLRDDASKRSRSPSPSQSSKPSIPKVPSRFVSPPQLVHEWEISAPRATRGPRLLPSLPSFLRKSSKTVNTTTGSSASNNSAITPFASPNQPLPALKRVSLHAHNSSIASAFAQSPPQSIPTGPSYSVTCTSDNRPDKRSGSKSIRSGYGGGARNAATKIATMSLDHPDAPFAPSVAPYTPGLREWDEDEFKKWEEEDDRLTALAAGGKGGSSKAKEIRRGSGSGVGLGGLVSGSLRRTLSISQRNQPPKGRVALDSESTTTTTSSSSRGSVSAAISPPEIAMPLSRF